jgi:hypothetical protein
MVAFYNASPFVILSKSVHAERALQWRSPRRVDGFRQNDKKNQLEGWCTDFFRRFHAEICAFCLRNICAKGFNLHSFLKLKHTLKQISPLPKAHWLDT